MVMTDPNANTMQPSKSLSRVHTQEAMDVEAAFRAKCARLGETPDTQTDKGIVQSLPYVRYRDGVGGLFGLDRRTQSSRRISTVTPFTTTTTTSSEGSDEIGTSSMRRLPWSLSYSVPSTSMVSNQPHGRPAVDVIATYMNTNDTRTTTKTDLLRSQAPHSSSPRSSSQSRLRTSSKESSADWGWFADLDSSSESWAGDGHSLSALRRKLSADDHTNAVHVLGDVQANTRLTSAYKSFTIFADGKTRVVAATVSIAKFRIVQSRNGSDRHAQYLITLRLGKELYADWRRYSEFVELQKKLSAERYPRSQVAWRAIDTRWFNRLEPSYLHQKCITLENFMSELMYESTDPSIMIEFLGGYMGKVNTRPADPAAYRPSAQLPKELRPPQPKHERELFEKMWAENFKRSRVDYSRTGKGA